MMISNRFIVGTQNREINKKNNLTLPRKIVADFLLTLHGAVKRINLFVSFQSWAFVSAGSSVSPKCPHTFQSGSPTIPLETAADQSPMTERDHC